MNITVNAIMPTTVEIDDIEAKRITANYLKYHYRFPKLFHTFLNQPYTNEVMLYADFPDPQVPAIFWRVLNEKEIQIAAIIAELEGNV